MEGRIKTEKVTKASIPKIGNIRCGIKVDKNGKSYTSSIDYFIADSSKTKEIYSQSFYEIYGDKPNSINIVFFSDDLNDSCWEQFEYRDTAGKKFAYGDGETYFVFSKKNKSYLEFTLNERKNLLQEIEKSSPGGKWSHVLRLKFIIVGINALGYWKLETKGELTSIPNIRETFDFIKEKSGRIAGIEFDLNVEMVKSDKPGDPRRYPVLIIVPKIPEKETLLLETPIKQIEG